MIPSSNGHQNGHTNGGQGGTAPEHPIDPHHRRKSYIMLQRAIDVATEVPVDAMKAAYLSAIKDIGSNDGRLRARAREFLLKMQDSGVAAALGLDKIERLDSGDPTERVSVLQFNIIESEPKHARTLDDGNEDG